MIGSTDPNGHTTAYEYDALGRRTEFTYAPNIGMLDANALAGLQLPNSHGYSEYREYDALDRLRQVVDADDQTTDYDYDLFGRLIGVSDAAGQTTTLVYDLLGNLEQVTDPLVETPLDRIATALHDQVGHRIAKTDYQGQVTTYQYDSTDRLVAETNSAYLQVSYHYDGAGRLVNRILSNGAQSDYRFDDDNRLIGLKNVSADGTVVEDLSYTRDRVGNITNVTDAVSGRTLDYTYAPLYRLTDVDSSRDSEDRSYTYDAVGNRLSKTAAGTTDYYCYHASDCSAPALGNRLVNIRTGSLTGPLFRQFLYDDAGRVIEKQDGAGTPLYSIIHNGKGRAASIDGHPFAYDPNDYRIAKDAKLYHLEGEHLEAIYGDTGILQNKYLRGVVIDELVNGYTYHSADPNDWTNYSFHHDHLNSVTALTGHTGTIEETTRYDAFGRPLSITLPGTGNDLLFTGRDYDRDTGLYYYRARYYDPEIGRFLSEDPLGFGAGVNFYAYVNNNPINYNDPTGYVAGKVAKEVLELGAAKLTATQLSRLRNQAVSDAWRLEQRLVKEGHPGSVAWTDTQVTELLETGRVKGFEGHHINNANDFPGLAGDPRNIQFVNGRIEHLDAH